MTAQALPIAGAGQVRVESGGQNVWAGVKGHLDAVTERAAAPVIAKYTGVLAAADIAEFTTTTTFQIMQSLRLDRGPTGPVHP